MLSDFFVPLPRLICVPSLRLQGQHASVYLSLTCATSCCCRWCLSDITHSKASAMCGLATCMSTPGRPCCPNELRGTIWELFFILNVNTVTWLSASILDIHNESFMKCSIMWPSQFGFHASWSVAKTSNPFFVFDNWESYLFFGPFSGFSSLKILLHWLEMEIVHTYLYLGLIITLLKSWLCNLGVE